MAFGFQSWNGNATTAISNTEVTARLVDTRFVAGNWARTLTLSVPKFNRTRGIILAVPYTLKFDFINNNRVADNAWMGGNYFQLLDSFGAYGTRFDNRPPTHTWNNATKVLTITMFGNTLSDFQFNFLHYK